MEKEIGWIPLPLPPSKAAILYTACSGPIGSSVMSLDLETLSALALSESQSCELLLRGSDLWAGN